MALKPPDMDKCTPKARCVGGENDGLAYDPADPCPSGATFNSLTCDCDYDTPLGNYRVFYRQESGGPLRCQAPNDPVCRRRCYSFDWNNVQNIVISSSTTLNTMCCGVDPQCSYATFDYNFIVSAQDSLGLPTTYSTGYWYVPNSYTNNNAIGGQYINNFYITGIQNIDTGVFVMGYDCTNDPDLCGGGHPNGECTVC